MCPGCVQGSRIAKGFGFIYCTNAQCNAARTGLSRVHLGPNQAGTCFRCNQPFPKRPNGATHGYAHYAAPLAGKPGGGNTVVCYKGNSGGKAAGKGNGGKAAGKVYIETLLWIIIPSSIAVLKSLETN